jgi:hypothetical protein
VRIAVSNHQHRCSNNMQKSTTHTVKCVELCNKLQQTRRSSHPDWN